MPSGRPTKYSDEIAEKIINLIKSGNYIEVAAAACGIAKSTLYDWMRKGARQKRGKLRRFSDAVHEAVALAEAVDVENLRQAGEKDWRASAFRLERKHRDRWGNQISIRLTDDELDDEIARLLQEMNNDDLTASGTTEGNAT